MRTGILIADNGKLSIKTRFETYATTYDSTKHPQYIDARVEFDRFHGWVCYPSNAAPVKLSSSRVEVIPGEFKDE